MSNTYKPIYKNRKLEGYKKSDGEEVCFWVESDEKYGDDVILYRTRSDGKSLYGEMLGNNQWHPFRLFNSYLFDALLEEITLEEAEEIAKRTGETLVD